MKVLGMVAIAMLCSAGLAQAEEDDKPIEFASVQSPDRSVRISWYVTAEEFREIRELDPDEPKLATRNLAHAGHVSPTCKMTSVSKTTRATARPKRCSVIFEPFSPDGKWVVFQRGDRWSKIEVVKLSKLLAYYKGAKADFEVTLPNESKSASARELLTWVGARGFVFTTICCGYTQVASFELPAGKVRKLDMIYGPKPLWHESPNGSWMAIGRRITGSGAAYRRIDLVSVDELASYLFEGTAAAASEEYRGRLAASPTWPANDHFSLRVKHRDQPVEIVSVSAPR